MKASVDKQSESSECVGGGELQRASEQEKAPMTHARGMCGDRSDGSIGIDGVWRLVRVAVEA